MRLARFVLLAGLIGVHVGSIGAQPADPLRLRLGDPDRRDKSAAVVLDGITQAATGEIIDPSELATRLQKVRVLLIGETHTNREDHRVQLQVLRALVATNRPVVLALEMLPYTQQAVLDQWQKADMDELTFVRRVGWFEHWGFHWGYYRDLFLFARDHRLPLVGINVPADFTSKIRQRGLGALTPEEAERLPPSGVDTSDREHLAFLKATVGDADGAHGQMNEETWQRMLTAQATWDATFAWQATRASERAGPDAIVVVLVGSGHVAYDLGIVRQARRWSQIGIASLVPVPTRSAAGEPIDAVRASYADYVWGVPGESAETFPMLGITTRENQSGNRVVSGITPNSPAALAGLQAGDTIVKMDGRALTDRYDVNLVMMLKQWGDAVRLVVVRGTTERTFVVHLRRRSLKP
ncbi:MAG: ChaN family lipoprotein [Vicinamibacterales bacterium]